MVSPYKQFVMLSLNAFKAQVGVQKLEFLKSKRTGQQFCEIGGEKIFISKKANLKEPLFVICNDGKVVADLKGTWWICNSTVDAGDIL